MEIKEYTEEVSKEMERVYGITWADACGDKEPLEQALQDGVIPELFVEWWGEKYDLTRKSELMLKEE